MAHSMSISKCNWKLDEIVQQRLLLVPFVLLIVNGRRCRRHGNIAWQTFAIHSHNFALWHTVAQRYCSIY